MTRTDWETEYVRRQWNVIRKFQDVQAAAQLLVRPGWIGDAWRHENVAVHADRQSAYDLANTNLEAAMHQLAEWVWEMVDSRIPVSETVVPEFDGPVSKGAFKHIQDEIRPLVDQAMSRKKP